MATIEIIQPHLRLKSIILETLDTIEFLKLKNVKDLTTLSEKPRLVEYNKPVGDVGNVPILEISHNSWAYLKYCEYENKKLYHKDEVLNLRLQ